MEYGLVLRWLALYAALAALGLPVAARLFANVRGRGAGFALPGAAVILTAGAYLLGRVAFDVAVAGAAVLLVAVSALAAVDLAALRDGRLAIGADVDRGAVADVAAVFLVGFLFVLSFRAVDPAVHAAGGEKFLDYGLLKSLARADSLPPEDVWFAGEPVRYYYGGHLFTSLLARLTATPPRYAYNLALAGFYAMLVAAAYDLAGAVAVDRGGARRPAGLLAVVFVGLASNLSTTVRYLTPSLPRSLRATLAGAGSEDSPFATEDFLTGTHEFSYWDASRVIPDTINEFPLFAWLNGDLHAHMMGAPFLLLAAGLSYAYYRTPATDRRRRLTLVFGAVPLLGGVQAVVDTWSFPSVFGLLWLSMTFAPADPRTLLPRPLAARLAGDGAPSTELIRPLAAAAVVAAAAGFAFAFALPFLSGAAAGREVAFVPSSKRSGLIPLLLVHGAFVAAFGAYLLSVVRIRRPLVLAAGVATLAAVSMAVDAPVLLIVGPLAVGAWVVLRMDLPAGYEVVLVLAGVGLVSIVELLYVDEQAGPLRMNTVFKTYMQVWVLWGTAMGVVLPSLVRRAADASVVPPALGRPVATAFVLALVLSTTPYAGLALDEHFDRGRTTAEPTLDATAFVEEHHPQEAPAIRRVDRIEGQPTLLSAPATSAPLNTNHDYPAPPGMYRWKSSPASSLTGVPTVAGWAHEVGYRGETAYFERASDVDAIYMGSDDRAKLLRKYDVRYVWVGPAERARYGAVSFERTDGVEPIFETESVTLYRVAPDQLPRSES